VRDISARYAPTVPPETTGPNPGTSSAAPWLRRGSERLSSASTSTRPLTSAACANDRHGDWGRVVGYHGVVTSDVVLASVISLVVVLNGWTFSHWLQQVAVPLSHQQRRRRPKIERWYLALTVMLCFALVLAALRS
jgi:hypothetical protein